MLANTGKNATMVAQTTSAANGSPTQMMISGAIATIGVTWSTTAQGWIAACASGLADIATAIAAPSIAATPSAANVTNRVEASESSSPCGSAKNAATIATGPGSTIDRHTGEPHRALPQRQRPKQPNRAGAHLNASASAMPRDTSATSAA